MPKGELRTINGPILAVRAHDPGFFVSELVKVGPKPLLGEVVALRTHRVIVQLFENPAGLTPGLEVIGTGTPLSVCLKPGIVSQIFDGIQRPLRVDRQASRKILTYQPPRTKESLSDIVFPSRNGNEDEPHWPVKITVTPGQQLNPGDVYAEVEETQAITFRAMVPPGLSGTVESCEPNGNYTADTPIISIETPEGHKNLTLTQYWPIREPRPIAARMAPSRPLITGQRIIDSFFPIAKGGTGAIPGGFGTGKTMTQHQIAKWADADIIVYIGCGERGNEMTDVLEDFAKLTDPRTGKPLLARTILIANTSDMPVAAREASIYTGMTLAECYRDMGYHVALMADSTSRWAEALREISGRLEEMPAEEGYPAYLASRLGSFYERAGYVTNLNGREGSITVVGAVSPQGADFSEPVTQNTKRFVRSFWALDKQLAYARHFPAIDWTNSYTGYIGDLEPWFIENVGPDFPKLRERLLAILQDESNLLEIAKLIGADILPDRERLTLALARVIRLGFAQQNAFHPSDVYTPLAKQQTMMEIILYLYDTCQKLLDAGLEMDVLQKEGIFERVIAVKYKEANTEEEMRLGYFGEIDGFFDRIMGGGKAEVRVAN
ncbi:MAG: V-type ATP synthase subunit A [Defluviitaleaceae bacterium]|nr:V-type ATP synthase subunit A [Defluviitaleaceae bacterium]